MKRYESRVPVFMPPDNKPAHLTVAFDSGPLHGHQTGIGVAVRHLRDALGDRDDVTVAPYLISGRSRPEPGEARLPLPGLLAARLWARSSYPRADRWLAGADVVHGTNYVAPPTRLPTVVSVYDCWFLAHPELASPVVARAGRWLRRCVDAGAWVHCCSTATATLAARLLATDRIAMVHLGPPNEIAAAPRKPVECPSAHVDVVAIGTEERRKGYPDLIQAFAVMDPSGDGPNLVIAGARGDDSDAIDARIASLPAHVAHRITRLGPITEGEKRWLLQHSSVLAYPSLDEGFGFPILEANRAGVAVVARDVGSIGEIAGDSARLVGDTASDQFSADFGSALADVLGKPGLAESLIERGNANWQRFSWDRCAAGLVDLYHRAISGRDTGRES